MSEPEIVSRLQRRVMFAELLGFRSGYLPTVPTVGVPRHSVIVMTGDELRQLEVFAWSTGHPPAHIERFDGRRIEIEEP